MAYTLRQIEEAVCLAFGVTSWDIHAETRTKRIARPRMTVWYLARQFTGLSFAHIAAGYGKHHSTVLQGADRVAELVASHPGMARCVERARNILATATPSGDAVVLTLAGDRRRRLVAFAQSHASSGARP